MNVRNLTQNPNDDSSIPYPSSPKVNLPTIELPKAKCQSHIGTIVPNRYKSLKNNTLFDHSGREKLEPPRSRGLLSYSQTQSKRTQMKCEVLLITKMNIFTKDLKLNSYPQLEKGDKLARRKKKNSEYSQKTLDIHKKL
jgi:hypothetical protein